MPRKGGSMIGQHLTTEEVGALVRASGHSRPGTDPEAHILYCATCSATVKATERILNTRKGEST